MAGHRLTRVDWLVLVSSRVNRLVHLGIGVLQIGVDGLRSLLVVGVVQRLLIVVHLRYRYNI